MPQRISNDDVASVIRLHKEVTGIKYHKEKRKRFSLLVSEASEEVEWLLTFSCWFCLFNTRFTSIDDSRYYLIPEKETNESTFQEFIEVLKFYNRKRVTITREETLIRFLVKCDRSIKDFYLSLLSKKFIKNLPLMEVQEVLSLSDMRSHDIYGCLTELHTSFSDLTYPVAITGVKNLDLPLCLVSREPSTIISMIQEGGRWAPSEALLPVDVTYIKTPRYTLVGYVAESEVSKRSLFYPTDLFGTRKEYAQYLKGKEVTSYEERIESLRKFQRDNLLTQVSTGYVGLAAAEKDIVSEVARVMEGNEYAYVALVDKSTSRTGAAHVVEVRKTVGIIHDFWVVDGEAKGYSIWFNGVLFDCNFPFSGKNNSLLNNISPVKGKLLEFYYLRIGNYRVGAGRQILWDVLPWRPKRLRFSEMHIEKCALCGGTGSHHARRGICKACECNLYQLYDTYGPGVWITPSKITANKRRASVWEPSLLNSVKYRHKGCLLVAREDGCWKFCEET